MLDLTGRLIVIIGGGAVAARKAKGVLDAGADRVLVVATEFLAEIPGKIERITAAYRADHLDGAGLVFAATDDARVNFAVVQDARARNILVNRADADEDEPGDFSTPAMVVRGALAITVSAGSAALSVAIRDQLKQSLDSRWSAMADAMQTLRPIIRRSIPDIARRRDILRELAGAESIDLLSREGFSGLGRKLADRFPELRALADGQD